MFQSIPQSTPEVVPEQQVLVELIGAIRAMPIDTLVQTLHQLVKSPPSVHGTDHVSIFLSPCPIICLQLTGWC